jgi:AraC family transcriptional regulator, regulatory protein of adaptative response / methylated-DNA-[protein]-cysteine methyltransferase
MIETATPPPAPGKGEFTFLPGARDYERIARAIGYLREHALEHPDLGMAARHARLSDHHFQRLFTRWAGVSPKRFLQYLTVEHAKACLASSRAVLDVAGEAGLSGPGRLHDLFVTLEAMSPGEYRAGGAGLAIRYGIHDSPFGAALIAATARGVCALHFLDGEGHGAALLRREWPGAALREDKGGTAALAGRIFNGLSQASARPLALLVKGTNFQIQVWRALLRLRPGSVISYRRVAECIGHTRATRAVGSAIGANPVAWLIPCHRVIRESGEPSRYRWGETRKAAMLGWEAARTSE